MPAVVPSYIAKLSRAKKHLIDLDQAVSDFAATHPYTVRETVESKKKRKVRRITFTADPANTDIPIITADAIYNMRSALDHLMSALVASNHRNSAMFPIFFQGSGNPESQGRTRSELKTGRAGPLTPRPCATVRSQS